MEIIGKPVSEAIDVYAPEPRSNAPATGRRRQPTPGSSTDKVVLSPKAKEINDARQLEAAIPDVREGKVQQVRQRITAGTYSVNAGKIAFNMIKESVFNQMA